MTIHHQLHLLKLSKLVLKLNDWIPLYCIWILLMNSVMIPLACILYGPGSQDIYLTPPPSKYHLSRNEPVNLTLTQLSHNSFVTNLFLPREQQSLCIFVSIVKSYLLEVWSITYRLLFSFTDHCWWIKVIIQMIVRVNSLNCANHPLFLHHYQHYWILWCYSYFDYY